MFGWQVSWYGIIVLFVRIFFAVMLPLTNLLKEGCSYVCTEGCQHALYSVKYLLCTELVLAAPDFAHPFKLDVEALDVGVGEILIQEDDMKIDYPVFSPKS